MPDFFGNIFGQAGLGVVVAALLNWAVVAPELGTRVLRADFGARCEANIAQAMAERGQARERAVKRPEILDNMDAARGALGQLNNTPYGQLFNQFGLGQQMAVLERRAAEAQRAYDAALDAAKAATSGELAASATLCERAYARAVSAAQTELAVWFGTATLVRLPKVRDLGALLDESLQAEVETLR